MNGEKIKTDGNDAWDMSGVSFRTADGETTTGGGLILSGRSAWEQRRAEIDVSKNAERAKRAVPVVKKTEKNVAEKKSDIPLRVRRAVVEGRAKRQGIPESDTKPFSESFTGFAGDYVEVGADTVQKPEVRESIELNIDEAFSSLVEDILKSEEKPKKEESGEKETQVKKEEEPRKKSVFSEIPAFLQGSKESAEIRKHPEKWLVVLDKSVAGNYYPIDKAVDYFKRMAEEVIEGKGSDEEVWKTMQLRNEILANKGFSEEEKATIDEIDNRPGFKIREVQFFKKKDEKSLKAREDDLKKVEAQHKLLTDGNFIERFSNLPKIRESNKRLDWTATDISNIRRSLEMRNKKIKELEEQIRLERKGK